LSILEILFFFFALGTLKMERQKQSVESQEPFLDSDRRHLLAPSIAPSVAPSIAPSVASSRPQSIVSFECDDDTESQSGQPPNHQTHTKRGPNTPYKGYPSEAAYLKALIEFGKESAYFESEDPLIGFYGTKTSEDYLREYAEAKAQRNAAKARRRAEKEEAKRRKSLRKGSLPTVAEAENGLEGDDGAVQPVGKRRMSKAFMGVFTRRATIA
jgi:hypothetical protein